MKSSLKRRLLARHGAGAALHATFNPDEARGNSGEWSSDSGTGASKLPPVSPKVKAAQFVTLYHGTTSEALQSIESKGLVPGGGAGGDVWLHDHFRELHPDADSIPPRVEKVLRTRAPSVFSTSHLAVALGYAQHASDVHPGSAPLLLKLEIPSSIVKSEFKPDELDYEAVRYEGTIPPKYIASYAEPGTAGSAKLAWKSMPTIHVGASSLRPTQVLYAVVMCSPTAVAAGRPGSGRYPKGSTNKDIGDALQKKITAHRASAINFYNKLSNTKGGRVLNTDEARELSPAYRKDRSRSAEVHEPASQFIKDLYAAKLAQPTPSGLIPTVLFTAGGTGAGKSTALKSDPSDVTKHAEIVYDTNMNSFPSAQHKIEQALTAGRKVNVAYTYRDPVEALTHGALPRAMRMGRTVPLAEHLKTHLGSRDTVAALQKTYAGNPNVTFRVFDNSRGPGGATLVNTVDDLPKIKDNGLEEQLHGVLEHAHSSGRISDVVYRGTLGSHAPARGVVQSGSGWTRQEPEPECTARTRRGSKAGAGVYGSKEGSGPQLEAGGPGSGRYPKGSTDNGLGKQGQGRVFVSPNVVLSSSSVSSALGVWADGAENSTELRTNSTDREARRYVGALAGKIANQKSVLDWENQKDGPHTLHLIRTAGDNSDTLNSKLGQAGIEFRTVQASPDGKSSRAYVLDRDGTLGNKITQFAKDNNYDHQQEKGTGDFIGSWDSREEGRKAYDKIIQAYEAKHSGKRYTGRLDFAASSGMGQRRLRESSRGIGERVRRRLGDDSIGRQVTHRLGMVTLATASPLQQNLARFMAAGWYRVSDGTSPAFITSIRGLAIATARLRSNRSTIMQVYDSTGAVVYASGGGKATLTFEEGTP